MSRRLTAKGVAHSLGIKATRAALRRIAAILGRARRSRANDEPPKRARKGPRKGRLTRQQAHALDLTGIEVAGYRVAKGPKDSLLRMKALADAVANFTVGGKRIATVSHRKFDDGIAVYVDVPLKRKVFATQIASVWRAKILGTRVSRFGYGYNLGGGGRDIKDVRFWLELHGKRHYRGYIPLTGSVTLRIGSAKPGQLVEALHHQVKHRWLLTYGAETEGYLREVENTQAQTSDVTRIESVRLVIRWHAHGVENEVQFKR